MPLHCHACGAPVTIGPPIPRDSECESCGHDLRCCTNCRHYDTRYNNSCVETEAELVEDKERRNFCEYFSFDPAPRASAARNAAKQADSRARLEGLFGGSGVPPGPISSAREKLESMFGNPPATDRAADARKKLDALFRKSDAGTPDEGREDS